MIMGGSLYSCDPAVPQRRLVSLHPTDEASSDGNFAGEVELEVCYWPLTAGTGVYTPIGTAVPSNGQVADVARGSGTPGACGTVHTPLRADVGRPPDSVARGPQGFVSAAVDTPPPHDCTNNSLNASDVMPAAVPSAAGATHHNHGVHARGQVDCVDRDHEQANMQQLPIASSSLSFEIRGGARATTPPGAKRQR